MTSEGDVLTALIALLRTKYATENFHFYTKEYTEGFVLPCLFVDCRLISEQPAGANVSRKEMSCVIDYFQSERNQEETISFVNDLRELFLDNGKKTRRMILKVGDRYIPVDDFSFGYVGQSNNIPEVTFSLMFVDSYATKDTTEKMGNMDINYQLGGNQ